MPLAWPPGAAAPNAGVAEAARLGISTCPRRLRIREPRTGPKEAAGRRGLLRLSGLAEPAEASRRRLGSSEETARRARAGRWLAKGRSRTGVCCGRERARAEVSRRATGGGSWRWLTGSERETGARGGSARAAEEAAALLLGGLTEGRRCRGRRAERRGGRRCAKAAFSRVRCGASVRWQVSGAWRRGQSALSDGSDGA